MPPEVRHQLPHGPEAPAAARDAVDTLLASHVNRDAMPDLRLCVSELVTNAVRHGDSQDGRVELAVEIAAGRLRVEVLDGGNGFVPVPRDPDPTAPGGWGLVVVDRLADRWGVEDTGGTRVWFEMNV
jgi:anti-sigma regulatory factor (Ser/Thr protein kinase)